MSKILAIADVHIHDYPQRNPSNKYRLYQARAVAANIIEAGKRAGADHIVLAGDILEKPVIRPYVQAEVKYFLDTIMANFKSGYIVWGNHDQDNKGMDQVFTDSCLSVMLPSNLYYAHRRELTIDGTRIAFSNWEPNFDLTWIQGTVDVLFTHATISYSKSDMVKSQPLDDSKFNVAICGDIHKPANIGKFVSIGVPQKCKMGDSDKATGVIYDTITKSWEWIDLNPSNNLMNFQYTPVQLDEGWDPNTGIWKVYRPESQVNAQGVKDIQIPAWEEVSNLIDNIIVNSNLTEIHKEVLSNTADLESNEVDFNFVMTRFYCKNWRSIEEVELYFSDLDKILITGRNGSGKSSLLSAIRYAFLENRFIKDFIQFNAKECIAEVDFIYQGNNFRIRRGSKSYGLWINAEAQKYNNKREFEEDVRNRFPFIDYMDVYFFDPDHHKLIGGITPERKSEIISKFFKLDRIDTFNQTAEKMLSHWSISTKKWQEEIDKQKKLQDYINQKLSFIQLPTVPKAELEITKAEGVEIMAKSKLWSNYQLTTVSLNTKLESCKKEWARLTSVKLRTVEEVQLDLQKTQDYITQINTEVETLNTTILRHSQLVQQKNQLELEKNSLESQLSSIGKPRSCGTCGQSINTAEADSKQKAILEPKLLEITVSLNNLCNQIKEFENISSQSEGKKAEYAANREKAINHQMNLSAELQQISANQKAIIDCEGQKNLVLQQLSQIIQPEQVILPENYIQIMSEIDANISVWNTYESLTQDSLNTQAAISNAELELSKITNTIEGLKEYVKITGTTGKIYEQIMSKFAAQFSDRIRSLY